MDPFAQLQSDIRSLIDVAIPEYQRMAFLPGLLSLRTELRNLTQMLRTQAPLDPLLADAVQADADLQSWIDDYTRTIQGIGGTVTPTGQLTGVPVSSAASVGVGFGVPGVTAPLSTQQPPTQSPPSPSGTGSTYAGSAGGSASPNAQPGLGGPLPPSPTQGAGSSPASVPTDVLYTPIGSGIDVAEEPAKGFAFLPNVPKLFVIGIGLALAYIVLTKGVRG